MITITKSIDKKNYLVVQSNSLVEAHYDTDLTATEHKILRYAAGKMRNSPDGFPSVSFSVREFLEAGGIKGDGYYSRFEKIADDLSRKRIKIQIEKNVGWFPWLSSLVYEDGEVHLTFNVLLKDMLLDLGKQFTKYDYTYIGDMRSAYTIRLFELLKQYAPLKRRRVNIDVLRKMLGIGDKYKQYGPFKIRVLQQAQKELAEKDGITFDFTEIKKGRKVVAIEFEIHLPKKNNPLPPRTETETFVKESEYLLDGYGIKVAKEKLSAWSKYGIELLNEVLKGIEGKDVRNHPAYIEKILETKYESWRDDKKNVKSDDDVHAGLVAGFIKENTSMSIIPEFHLKTMFVSHIEEHVSEESIIEQLWEDNREYIVEKTASYKKR